MEEIKKLVPFILERKRPQDEIVILYDNKNGNPEVLEFLLPYNKLPNVQTWRCFDWNDDFANFKNILNGYCEGDYIYQIDADEMISEYMIQNLSTILELNPKVDLIFVPRINTVNGITQEHINKWGWRVNENGWINFHDVQGRLYQKKQSMFWNGKVHEAVQGFESYSIFPQDEVYCIKHIKEIEKQEKQNALYETI